MYNDNKTIEDVLKYLYENKQEDLAKEVLNLIRAYERASEAVMVRSALDNGGTGTSLDPTPFKITCDSGQNRV